MFRDCITSTALTGEIPDMSLGHINGTGFRGDISFIASARAFLANRMRDGEHLTIGFDAHNGRQTPFADTADTLAVVSIVGSKEQSVEAFKQIDEKFLNEREGFELVPKIGAFYERSFAARCFVNKARRISVVFADHIDMRTLHFLECSILIMLPWYHEREPKLTDDETALVKCLMSKESTSVDYLKCIKAIASRFDFRTTAIKSMLSDFENKYRREQLSRARSTVENYRTKIDDLLAQLAVTSRERDDAMVRVLGLEAAISQSGGDSELVNFFIAHKNIELVGMIDGGYKVAIKTQYSPESIDETNTIKRVLAQDNSIVYCSGGSRYENESSISAKDMKMLLTAIFVDGVLKLNLCAAYNIGLRLDTHRVPIGNYDFSHEYDDYMPNPHIQSYRCIGNYTTKFADLMRRGDYIGMTVQCIASAGSLNFNDPSVMHEFMEIMHGIKRGNNKAIVLPDGKVVKPEEAIAWLKEQKGE